MGKNKNQLINSAATNFADVLANYIDNGAKVLGKYGIIGLSFPSDGKRFSDYFEGVHDVLVINKSEIMSDNSELRAVSLKVNQGESTPVSGKNLKDASVTYKRVLYETLAASVTSGALPRYLNSEAGKKFLESDPKCTTSDLIGTGYYTLPVSYSGVDSSVAECGTIYNLAVYKKSNNVLSGRSTITLSHNSFMKAAYRAINDEKVLRAFVKSLKPMVTNCKSAK